MFIDLYKRFKIKEEIILKKYLFLKKLKIKKLTDKRILNEINQWRNYYEEKYNL